MGLIQRVAYNTTVQVLGRIMTVAASLVLVGSLTRYLGVTGFGKYTTIFAYVAFFAVLADFGFFNILVREIAAGRFEIKRVVNNVLTLRAILALLVYLLAFVLAFIIARFRPVYDAEVRFGIGLIALAQFWLTLNSTLVGVFQAKLRMDKAVISDVLGRLITLSAVLLFINLKMSLLIIISGYVFGGLANFIFSILFSRQYVKIRLGWDTEYLRKIAKITLPMGMLTIITYVYFHIDMIILSLLRSQYDVGIYGASYKILEILLALPAIFTGAVLPIMTRYIVDRDRRLSLLFQQSFNFLLATGLPLALGVFVLARPVISFVAGEEFVRAVAPGITFWGEPATAALTLQILAIALFLSFLSHLFSTAVIAWGRQSALVLPNIFLMIINIALNLVLIPRYSYLAAAFITVLGEFFVLLFPILVIYRGQAVLPRLNALPKIILSATVMAVFLIVFINFSLIPLIVMAAGIYFLVLYLSGGVPKEVIREVSSFKIPL